MLAERRKGQMNKLTASVSILFLIIFLNVMFKTEPVVADIKNKVWFEVSRGYWLGTDEDIVTNVPQPRSHQWLFQIHNVEDETGQPVINPCITVRSDREFIDFSPWPSSISDGQYQWEFALELPEGFLLPANAREPNFIDYSSPGFSAERSVSPETLVEPLTIQTLSLTLTLEDPLPAAVNHIFIEIGLPTVIFHEERLVNYTVLSLSNVEDWSTYTKGWYANPADLSIGMTYHFEAILEAVKSPDFAILTAKPAVAIIYMHWDDLGMIGTGSFAAATHPEGPTMTVSAEGEYEWYAGVSYTRQDFWFHQRTWPPIGTTISVEGKDYPVTIVSNTTIEQIIATSNTLHFKSSGPTGDKGYVHVTFPMVNTTEIKVFVDGVKLTPPPFPVIDSNGTHYFIYFEFTLSTHDVAIQFAPPAPPVGGVWVPINKSALLAPLIGLASIITVAAASVVYVKHKKKKQT